MGNDINVSLPVIFLMGPTASGKTSLAVDLYRSLAVEIVSVDSAMVYRGMDIGTAKPTADILKIAPHRLIDICEPSEGYSAGRFCEDALKAIDKIHSANKIPLLVGGTGLYFRSLEEGIAPLPSANPIIRASLDKDFRSHGAQIMHKRLQSVDPESALRIHPNDPQRIQRALEVYEITGKSLSELISASRHEPLPFPVIKLIINPIDRSIIHERIRKRFLQMIELGLVDEVRQFHNKSDLSPELPSMRMVGYRQVWRYLDGQYSQEQMLEHGIVATRQLAKRQLTWLRSEKNAQWFDSNQSEILDNVLKYLRENHKLCFDV